MAFCLLSLQFFLLAFSPARKNGKVYYAYENCFTAAAAARNNAAKVTQHKRNTHTKMNNDSELGTVNGERERRTRHEER